MKITQEKLMQHLQGFQHQQQEEERERDSQTPVGTAVADGANIIIVSSSPMIAKPAVKRKSSNGSLKGGASQISTNGMENGNGGGRQTQGQVDVVRAYPGQQQRPSVGVHSRNKPLQMKSKRTLCLSTGPTGISTSQSAR